MHSINSVIWKELKEMRYHIKIILGLIVFIVAFLIWTLVLVSNKTFLIAFSDIENYAVSIVFYAQLFTMFVIGSTMISYNFYNERLEKTLEPLLCTPLNITVIWLGKLIAILLISYIWSIIITISIIIVFRLFLSFTIFISVPILVQIFIVSPFLITASVALVGFILLVFKSIQITKYVTVFILVSLSTLVLKFLRGGIIKPILISWQSIGLSLLISIALIIVLACCTRFLRKEKII